MEWARVDKGGYVWDGYMLDVCVCACVLARQIGSFFLAFMIRYPCFSVASLLINKVMWGMQKDSSNPKTWKWKPFDLLFRIRIFYLKTDEWDVERRISWMPSLSFWSGRECPRKHSLTHSLNPHLSNPFPTLLGTVAQFPKYYYYYYFTLHIYVIIYANHAPIII